MNKDFYYNSVSLGSELRISGSFIYDGCQQLYNYINNSNPVDPKVDSFSILYNLSVGIERLQKILVILLEDVKSEEDLKDIKYSKALHGHNHEELAQAIRDETGNKIIFSKDENNLLSCFSSFYKKNRYGHYQFNSTSDDTIKNLMETAGVPNNNKPDFPYSAYSQDKKNTISAFEVIKHSIIIITKKYLKLLLKLTEEKNIYTIENETHHKLFSIFHYKNDIFRYFKLKEYAHYELLYFITEKEDKRYSTIPFDKSIVNYFLDSIIYQDNSSQLISNCDLYYNEMFNDEHLYPSEIELNETLQKLNIEKDMYNSYPVEKKISFIVKNMRIPSIKYFLISNTFY